MIVLDDQIYNGTLNLPSFLNYACGREILKCRSFKGLRQIFLSAVIIMTVLLLSCCIYICKKNIDVKFKMAIEEEFKNKMIQYGKVGKEALPESVVERLDASMDSSTGGNSLISDISMKSSNV